MSYKIDILKCGRTQSPGPELFWMSDWDQTYPLNVYIYVVRGEDRTILVDTGLRDLNEINPMCVPSSSQFSIEPGEDTVSVLQSQGIKPEDVTDVIPTHFHYDHISNVKLFKKAEIFASKRGFLNVAAPKHPQLAPPVAFPKDVVSYMIEEAWERVHLINEEEIYPGITIFWTGGHTPGNQAISIKTDKGIVTITGDVVFFYRNIEENIPA
ncbi:MAG: MBL fold metallo-hydrolase, partial [Candidatus Aenigmarchaeota archaeon]|nr:MBL fold metallo-hydrolase [Candidatus Aenigmarchaeota archaeon]